MNRYNDTKITITKNNKKSNNAGITKLSTTLYKIIPEQNDDIYVMSTEGDRLDNLAAQFYGDVNLWWYIAKANNLTFMTIPVGTRLRIPGTTQYAIGI